MFQQQVYIVNSILMILDAVCVILGGCAAYLYMLETSTGLWALRPEVFLVSLLFMVLVNNFILGQLRLYSDIKPDSFLQLTIALVKAIAFDFIVLAGAVFVFRPEGFNREFILAFMIFTSMFLFLERYVAQFYISRKAKDNYNVRRLLVVGDKARAEHVIKALDRQLSWGHKIVGNICVNEGEKEKLIEELENLPEILIQKEVDEVIFALGGDRSIPLWKYLNLCRKKGVTTRILPALWKPGLGSIRVEECQGIPFLTVHVNSFSASGLLYKRLLDIVGGFIGSVIFLILYPFVAIATKLDSPGPVLFKQERVGKNGRVFKLLKFRTMYVDAEKQKAWLTHKNVMNGPIFKLKDDPRITRVGRFLRKTSIDEFPQFLNVLKGEMSLVGTRPPTPEEVKNYALWHHRRISAKPGITGLWQISGRNKIRDFDTIVELDCAYLDRWRFMDDLKILWKTIFVVLARKGAL
ncbi:MAG TPA: sugar transferase [Deltaproteobacteria bacterium]|nr:sugar transferase [Deltaproteobacteria bacterium]